MLYLRSGRFACRHCQRVSHASQSEDALARLWRKQSKIEARLGDYWRRPKGMRRRTYDLLVAALVHYEELRETALGALIVDLFGRPS